MRRLVIRFNSGISRDFIGGNEDIHWLYSHLCPTGIDGDIEIFDWSTRAIARHFDKPQRCRDCNQVVGSIHTALCKMRGGAWRVDIDDCTPKPKPKPKPKVVYDEGTTASDMLYELVKEADEKGGRIRSVSRYNVDRARHLLKTLGYETTRRCVNCKSPLGEQHFLQCPRHQAMNSPVEHEDCDA